MALTVHVDTSFPREAEALLASGLGHHTVLRPARPTTSNLAPAAASDPVEADVAFGQPSVHALAASPRVRWVHLTSAGYTRYAEPAVRDELARRGVMLTTSSSVYAEPCATHAMALVLALLRQLPAAMAEQSGRRAWPATELRSRSRVLSGAVVLLLGLGAIGRRLSELLAPWGADVVAFRSRVRGDEPVRTVDASGLTAELARADVVISSLPQAAGTVGLLDRERIAAMKPGAIFVNVGRGTTVDQSALEAALASGRLGGVGLDVTDPEPLPADHPLWSSARCVITPHTAGGRFDEHTRLVAHFVQNLERYERGVPLVDRVI